MDEVLTIDELKARYPNEHLLLVDFISNEFGQVVAGRVLCHSKDAEEMWRQGLALQPKRCERVFTATIPDEMIEDMTYCLSPFLIEPEDEAEADMP